MINKLMEEGKLLRHQISCAGWTTNSLMNEKAADECGATQYLNHNDHPVWYLKRKTAKTIRSFFCTTQLLQKVATNPDAVGEELQETSEGRWRDIAATLRLTLRRRLEFWAATLSRGSASVKCLVLKVGVDSASPRRPYDLKVLNQLIRLLSICGDRFRNTSGWAWAQTSTRS